MTAQINCDEALEALEAAADGPLPADSAAKLEQHLAGCEACTAERGRMAAYDLLMGGLQFPQAGPELAQRLRLDQLEQQAQQGDAPAVARPGGRRWRLPPAAIAASGLFVILAIGLSFRTFKLSRSPLAESSVARMKPAAAQDRQPQQPLLDQFAEAHGLYLQGRADESIAAFESLLARAPREAGVSDKALFFVGEMQETRKQDKQLARIAYEKLLERFPESELAPSALARVAQISGTRTLYVDLTRRFPKSPQARRAALKLARQATAEKDKQEARRWWRWLLENAAGGAEWQAARKALKEDR